MKRFLRAAGVGLCLTAAPLAAQTNDIDTTSAELEQVMGALGEMFPAEPLTAEQEARLPLAQDLVALMIPEGTMGDIMGQMFDDMLGPIMQAGGTPAVLTVSRATGVTPFELDLDEEEAGQIAALFDPAFAERQERQMSVFPSLMREMMITMEPGLRKAMSEAFAIRFTDTAVSYTHLTLPTIYSV